MTLKFSHNFLIMDIKFISVPSVPPLAAITAQVLPLQPDLPTLERDINLVLANIGKQKIRKLMLLWDQGAVIAAYGGTLGTEMNLMSIIRNCDFKF